MIVDGDRSAWPATRESRLVAWANDLFQQAREGPGDWRQMAGGWGLRGLALAG